MKQKKLASLLAVTLSLELMIAPIIPSVQAQTQMPPQAQTSSTASAINTGLQMIGQVWNQINGANNPSPQFMAEMQQLAGQQTPRPDKFFNPQKLSQIPGLGQYMALNNINPNLLHCPTLQTSLVEIKSEVCRIGVTTDTGVDPASQMSQMQTYFNQYSQIAKVYKTYSLDSNSDGQAFGVGCMNNAMNILNGFFKYRLDELDKLTTNIEALQNQFREASRTDLNAIEESVAVLDGDSPIADKVRSRRPDLFDFDKSFNNPACKSMFAGDKLNDLGRATGLNSINRDIKNKLTEKVGRYSGESYSQSHASVLEDINSVADKVAKQVELNFGTTARDPSKYSEFLKNVSGSISSTTGVSDSIRLDMFSDVQEKFNEKFIKFSEDTNVVTSELPSAQKALGLMGGLDNANFEAELVTLENKMKNDCLVETLAGAGSRDQLMNKIYDPTGSKHANKHASNFYKDKLNQILDNKETSIEKKLADLKALESQQKNRYYMKMENSYEIQDVDANGNISTRVANASTNRTPAVFFSDIIRNCNAQFKANKLGNKLTGEAAIQKIRKLNQDYKSFLKTQTADIKKEVRKKLIECTSPEIANNTVPGSCGPQLFNPQTPGFCANAAFSCSKNMQACSKQAETYVKQIRDQKTARVNSYKNLMQKNKMDMVKIFDSALTRYMKDGEGMRALFGAGFSSPSGIEREVPEGQRYLKEFVESTGKQGSPDGRLLLEDPDAYTAMFKKNIALLKKSVEDQQNQILGGESVGKNDGLLADHIKKTKEAYAAVAKDADAIASTCQQQYDKTVLANEAAKKQANDDFLKQQNEMGEKRNEICDRWNHIVQKHPGPACDGEAGTLARAMNDRDFANYCASVQSDKSASSGYQVSAYKKCLAILGQVPISEKDKQQVAAQATSDKVESCKNLLKCGSSAPQIDPSDDKKSYVLGCDDTYKSSLAEFILDIPSNDAPSYDTVPSYCAEVDNSGRNLGPKIMETFGQSLAQGLGGGAAAPR